MKVSERISTLLPNPSLEETRAMGQRLIGEGHKQAAIDLYRCIVGNGRTLTKHVDVNSLALLVVAVEKAEAEGLPYMRMEG